MEIDKIVKVSELIELSQILVLLFAGWGAGTVTGLIGASAVVVVVPLLLVLLDIEAYQAIGISLTTDIFASLTAALTFSRYGNINLKSGIQIAVLAVIGSIVGSWFSAFFPSTELGGLTGVVIFFVGISFLKKPITIRATEFREMVDLSYFKKREILSSAFFGLLIGLISGIFGAGGGVMILMILVFILDYDIHTAIGTSVLIMMFTALSGGVAHFAFESFSPIMALFAVIGGVLGAGSAAIFANLADEEKLARIVGVAFIALGVLTVLSEFIV